MYKRWLIFAVIICFGAGLLLSFGIDGFCSEEGEQEKLVESPIFISVPEMFETLERPPVLFLHNKHAVALEEEGCETCHPKDENNKLVFTFPKVKDEKSRKRLINSYHDACINCHKERFEEGRKAGAVTCGGCHVIGDDYHTIEYLPILPEYYEPIRDTYHKNCIACHRDPAKSAEDAKGLDWKSFYIKETRQMKIEWPKVDFDYYLHNKHDVALEKKCELCHYLSPETEKKLAMEGNESNCQDWLSQEDENNRLTEQKSAHARCIGCHLERKQENINTGPLYCNECHSGMERTIEELADIPRQECDQEAVILIQIEEDARMKGVPFNHKSHQASVRSCQSCHHNTLNACATCHTLNGSEDGGNITLAEAYHDASSKWSCIGCHEAEKRKPQCAGCHHLMKGGLLESSCSKCHSGSLNDLDNGTKLGKPDNLYPEDLKKEMSISLIENEYGPSKFPHDNIVKKLTAISDNSSLAKYFHVNNTSICSGCHHYGPVDAKKKVPLCSTCHTARKEPRKNMPTLLGAYHQQCLGCHKQMQGTEEEMPQDCTGCHEEKNQELKN